MSKLLPWEDTSTVVGFEIHMGGSWWKMASEGQQLSIKLLSEKLKW
jgi:hypothetical protein